MIINEKKIADEVERSKKHLEELSGPKRLAFLLKMNLLKVAKFYSRDVAEDILNENFGLIEVENSKEAAQLLVIKAYIASINTDLDEAKIIVEKALSKARAVQSPQLEAAALAIKGYHKETEKQYDKAVDYYLKALNQVSEVFKADVLRQLGICYGKHGNYPLARHYLDETIKQTEDIINSSSVSADQKSNHLEIQTDTLSRLATIYEGLDDLESAEKAHDKAIGMARDNNFILALYRALSRKVKFFILTNKYDLANTFLTEAESLSAERFDPGVPLYVAQDWARLFRFSAKNNDDRQKALNKYREILYGDFEDKLDRDNRVLSLMKNMSILFDEVTSGIYECLIMMRMREEDVLAKKLKEAMDSYNTVLAESGIFVEIDKRGKLDKERENIIEILEVILEKPHEIFYKDIFARYKRGDKHAIATFSSSGKKIEFSEKAFFIFECFYKNKGKCVTEKEILNYWEDNGVPFDPASSGFSTALNRDLIERLGLAPYIKKCPKPEGWQLLP
jgi:tetratricopeptide (TPR) repeat protein